MDSNKNEKIVGIKTNPKQGDELYPIETTTDQSVHQGHVGNVDELQRHLGNRQLQLIAIGMSIMRNNTHYGISIPSLRMLTKCSVGGSIGTATFVSISSGLLKGGPGSLFLAYTIYTCMLGLVNNCQAEMSSYMPVTGGFIRMSGKWVDEALGFMIGWSKSLSLTPCVF